MKKLFLMVIAMVALLSIDVYAMSEKELQEKFTKEYVINGVTFKLDSSYVAQLERYLNENEISESDADFIASKIDEAVKIVEAGNTKSVKELTSSEKNKLKDLVADISNETEIKATVEKGGDITLYNVDGTVFSEISDPIKYTDDNTIAIITLGTVAVVIGAVVLTKKKVLANV